MPSRSKTMLRHCSPRSSAPTCFSFAVNARFARLLVWAFNIEGTLDLITAIVLATIYDAAPYMGPAYWIPAFWVPALLVTHYITFRILFKYWNRTNNAW